VIDIDEIHLWTIVGVSHGEGDERIHIGSARRDGAMIVLHEQNNGTDCCDGRVTVVPLASVTEMQILRDADSLRRAIEEDGIAFPGSEARPHPGPEVM